MRAFVLVTICVFWVPAARADEALLQAARLALTRGDAAEAQAAADKVLAADPKNVQALYYRGLSHELRQRHADAIADFDKLLAIEPNNVVALDHRGSEHFKLGRIKESLVDFDRVVMLNPREAPGHWKRGISLYYAGRYDEGCKQFEAYEQKDTNDVENAVWHFLCAARASGVEKARAGLLKIGNDGRTPMMQVYALYAGKLKPEDVLAAARAGKGRAAEPNAPLFYAHLYLGLYYEILGDNKQALEHMRRAAEDHRIGHYMWDVANVHHQLLKKLVDKGS